MVWPQVSADILKFRFRVVGLLSSLRYWGVQMNVVVLRTISGVLVQKSNELLCSRVV